MSIRYRIIFFAALFLSLSSPALAAGPWKGRVIDSDTKGPLEGAVVLAVWERVWRTPTGGNSYFYEAKETLTDKDGRFEIPSYTPINIFPIISYMDGPVFTIFKPIYGSFPRHRTSPEFRISDPDLAEFFTHETDTTGELGIDYATSKPHHVTFGVVELPRLKTREERLRNLDSVVGFPMGRAPDYKIKRFLETVDNETKDLGLKK
ncbi:MAG: hypothetical protein HY894_01210 [Deltaproteobacteria bacterium]|nr:hypothetical protein [Deltaproteobacteria bacterium]